MCASYMVGNMIRFISGLPILTLVLLLLPVGAGAQVYKTWTPAQRWSATAELGGFSPILSINAEHTPLASRKGFLVLRGGGGHSLSRSVLCSLPHAVSWNILLNGNTKGCPPASPGNSTFLEWGVGGVYPLYTRKDIGTAYLWSPLLGVRHYFRYNVRATGFWKAQLTPLLTGQWSPWLGLSFGLVID